MEWRKPSVCRSGRTKEQSERERRLDRDIRIKRLGAAFAGLRRRPAVHGVLTDPQGDVARIAQRLVVLAPVCHAIRSFVFRMSLGLFWGSVMHFTVGCWDWL